MLQVGLRETGKPDGEANFLKSQPAIMSNQQASLIIAFAEHKEIINAYKTDPLRRWRGLREIYGKVEPIRRQGFS